MDPPADVPRTKKAKKAARSDAEAREPALAPAAPPPETATLPFVDAREALSERSGSDDGAPPEPAGEEMPSPDLAAEVEVAGDAAEDAAAEAEAFGPDTPEERSPAKAFEPALLSDCSLLDPGAAPPPPPSEYPITVRRARGAARVSWGADTLENPARPSAHPPCAALPLGVAPTRTPRAPHPPLHGSQPAPRRALTPPRQLAVLDVVRQSHVLAGAVVGVVCGVAFSLRKIRTGWR